MESWEILLERTLDADDAVATAALKSIGTLLVREYSEQGHLAGKGGGDATFSESGAIRARFMHEISRSIVTWMHGRYENIYARFRRLQDVHQVACFLSLVFAATHSLPSSESGTSASRSGLPYPLLELMRSHVIPALATINTHDTMEAALATLVAAERAGWPEMWCEAVAQSMVLTWERNAYLGVASSVILIDILPHIPPKANQQLTLTLTLIGCHIPPKANQQLLPKLLRVAQPLIASSSEVHTTVCFAPTLTLTLTLTLILTLTIA